jgi:hypothetical protein
MNAKKLLVTLVVVLVGAPAAMAGVDRGIGIPAGRDAVPSTAPLVSEKTAGLFQSQQPSSLVSEKTSGLWRTPAPVSVASPLATVDGGFDWSDAGVGAGITLASLAFASAGALAIRRRGLPAH